MNYSSPWVKDCIDLPSVLSQYKNSTKIYNKGSYIYYQEEKIEYLHFIIDGRVKIFITNADGQEKTLAIHESGSFFGEAAFFDKQNTFASSQALSDSKILSLTKMQVTDMFSQNPSIAFFLMKSFSRKIRLLSFQVEYLSFFSIEKRLLALLLSLFDVFGIPCENIKGHNCPDNKLCLTGIKLSLSITDQELGNMLGVRREAVTKSLKKLKEANLIQKNYRILCCPNYQKISEYLLSESN